MQYLLIQGDPKNMAQTEFYIFEILSADTIMVSVTSISWGSSSPTNPDRYIDCIWFGNEG